MVSFSSCRPALGHCCLNLKCPPKAHVSNACSSTVMLFWQVAGPLGGGPCLRKRVPGDRTLKHIPNPDLLCGSSGSTEMGTAVIYCLLLPLGCSAQTRGLSSFALVTSKTIEPKWIFIPMSSFYQVFGSQPTRYRILKTDARKVGLFMLKLVGFP